jgi:hypothetical protein
MNRLRASMSPDEKAKMKEKEKNGRKILRDGMSLMKRPKQGRKKQYQGRD